MRLQDGVGAVEPEGDNGQGRQPAQGVRVPRPLEILVVLSEGARDYPDLCAMFPFSRARMSYLLRQLEESRLIRRRRMPVDRRRVRIEITPAGLKSLELLRRRPGEALEDEDEEASGPRWHHGLAAPSAAALQAERGGHKGRHSPLVAALRKHVTETIESVPEDEQATVTSVVVQALSALMISGQHCAASGGNLQQAADRLTRALWSALPPEGEKPARTVPKSG